MLIIRNLNLISVQSWTYLHISDHLMVYGIFTERIKYHQSKVITFPDFKNLDTGKLEETLSIAPWYVGEMFDCVEDCYDYWIKLLRAILQECLPVKKMKVRERDVPYMTTAWKSARTKRKFAKRYSQSKTSENLELKRKWRNEAARQRRIAIKQYWKEVSHDLKSNPKNLFQTFKPFLDRKDKEDNMKREIHLSIDG